ncbi:hypothetical protein EW146_g2 [Bondarzewia mesenterica]|uniref:Uncharacterized protein n=1 Tax=Bondarzewia mesenterica TaxID=1095465 RepID=A0A4V3XGI4_9AGAM|nr:hypothetical protein EW146_g2 [Bondarzewia mesenterica]
MYVYYDAQVAVTIKGDVDPQARWAHGKSLDTLLEQSGSSTRSWKPISVLGVWNLPIGTAWIISDSEEQYDPSMLERELGSDGSLKASNSFKRTEKSVPTRCVSRIFPYPT